MLTFITAQPFHELWFSVCSSRAVLTKQIIAQCCLMVLGWVLVLHNHAEISVVLFILPPQCSWQGCAGEREVLTYSCLLYVVSVTPSDGSGWRGNDTSPSHCRTQGGNSALNSWSVNKAALRAC